MSAGATARRALASAVKGASVALDAVAAPGPGVVVLAYHQVGAPEPGPVNLAVERFDEQMAVVGASYRPSTLDDAVEALDRIDPEPGPRRVVVTFDDGTADFVDCALEVLVRHRIPATLYLATSFVEEGRSFWGDGTVLSWAALADALSTGLVTIASHTHSHLLADRVPPDVLADDLDRSVELIGERLGVRARHLAYPKALAPAGPSATATIAVVADRFRSAAVAGSRPNPYGRTDPMLLARTPIQSGDDREWFARKVDGGLRLEGAMRAALDRRRHRGATR